MKLAVFHYHLRPGGVTGVVTQACVALGRHGRTVEEITLVSGSGENADAVRARIEAGAPELPVTVRVHPELRYVSEQDDIAMDELERRIESLLRREYLAADTVWWVHNYHLGKNAAFTAALIELLESEPAQRAVFQIHDFPECARFENLAEVRTHVPGRVYPVLPNLAYATINMRDRRLLVEAGLPEGAVFALPNPVPTTVAGGTRTAARAEVTGRLAQAFGGRFPAFDPDGRLLLYPVRAIRRKNVLEAGFLTGLLNTELERPANLLVSLPGTSPLEKPYSDLVETAFCDGVMPGMAGVGGDLAVAGLTFEEIAAAADLIVSTSVQEGFGYAFFEAPARGAPLFARYLDILDGLDGVFEGYPAAFYRQLRVPFECPSIDSVRALLRIRYDEQIGRAAADMPPAAREQVEAEISEMLDAPTIDFSFLMPQMQYAYAKDLADEGFANEVRALNVEVLGPLLRLIERPPEAGAAAASGAARNTGAARIAAELGYEPYAGRVEALLSRLADRAGGGNGSRSTAGGRMEGHGGDRVQQHLIEAFAHREYFRLLYGPVGE
jgi:glycosyltransferase involved in cell wall biosynthesis